MLSGKLETLLSLAIIVPVLHPCGYFSNNPGKSKLLKTPKRLGVSTLKSPQVVVFVNIKPTKLYEEKYSDIYFFQ